MDDVSSDFRVLYTEDLYQENGMCVPVDIAQSPMRTPERLIWETSKELAIKVDQAWISNQEVLEKIILIIIIVLKKVSMTVDHH